MSTQEKGRNRHLCRLSSPYYCTATMNPCQTLQNSQSTRNRREQTPFKNTKEERRLSKNAFQHTLQLLRQWILGPLAPQVIKPRRQINRLVRRIGRRTLIAITMSPLAMASRLPRTILRPIVILPSPSLLVPALGPDRRDLARRALWREIELDGFLAAHFRRFGRRRARR